MAGTTDLTTLFEGYRLCCLAEGKSPKTIRWYMHKLRIFLLTAKYGHGILPAYGIRYASPLQNARREPRR